MKAIMLVLACALVVSCESGKEAAGDGQGSFNDGNASGKVQAKDFTFFSGRTRVHPSGGNQWLIELYSNEITQPCGVSFSPEYYINFSIPKVEGSYEVTPSRSVSFVYAIPNGAQVAVATTGDIQIVRIEEGVVTGKIASRFNDDNRINGEFWAQICD